jgi:hypothetical protein
LGVGYCKKSISYYTLYERNSSGTSNINWFISIGKKKKKKLDLIKPGFLKTLVGNKYGPVVLPTELSITDFNNIKNVASDLNKGKIPKIESMLDKF